MEIIRREIVDFLSPQLPERKVIIFLAVMEAGIGSLDDDIHGQSVDVIVLFPQIAFRKVIADNHGHDLDKWRRSILKKRASKEVR